MARSVEEIIDEIGFEYKGMVPADKLRTTEDVRGMCAANKCGFYDKNWQCPPACGSVDEWQQRFSQMSTCYVFQTVFDMEDDFDFETIEEAGEAHDKRLFELAKAMGEEHPEALVLGAGPCKICSECTYPDKPCRLPKVATTAMEAAGLMVNTVCRDAGVEYNHGPRTCTFVSCVVV